MDTIQRTAQQRVCRKPHFFQYTLLREKNYFFLVRFLFTTRFIKTDKSNNISWTDSFLIGIAQAIAVLPGISRSGITISTGLLLGNNREETARFSFLMVIIPVIGAALIEFKDATHIQNAGSGVGVYFAGFLAAFISGLFACKWMIKLVKTGNLVYFSVYCFIAGMMTIFFT